MGASNRLFWGSFTTLVAAGIGFGIRGAILIEWSSQFGFTQGELGTITGGGLAGFGIAIIIMSFFAEGFGFRKLMWFGFVLHLLSAVITLAATPVYEALGKDATFWCLNIAMWCFAIGNGTCEGVINPLVAAIYPDDKTHKLNILHAGWPAGLLLGGLASFLLAGTIRWEIQMCIFLIPTLVYGHLMLREQFPLSEAGKIGIPVSRMLVESARPLLFALLFLQACVGWVELGTDSWITNLMTNIAGFNGVVVFIYTSLIMMVLRFFAGPIERAIGLGPLGLLLASSVLAVIGLGFLGYTTTALAIFAAATVYALGKTFWWPTMLAVVSQQFPRGGALALGSVGMVGMLSAGFLGGPGMGYIQDRHASQHLVAAAPDTYARFASADPKSFLFFEPVAGLDGQKVGELRARALDDQLTATEKKDWDVVDAAVVHGGQMSLRITSYLPGVMALCFLLLIMYFKSVGGYKPQAVTAEAT